MATVTTNINAASIDLTNSFVFMRRTSLYVCVVIPIMYDWELFTNKTLATMAYRGFDARQIDKKMTRETLS